MSITIYRQILIYALLPALILLVSFNAKKETKHSTKIETEINMVPVHDAFKYLYGSNTPVELTNDIRYIFQDKNDNYWFATNEAGLYRYDPNLNDPLRMGRSLTQFTEKDGLPNSQVQTIQEDKSGNLWFGMTGFVISRFSPSAVMVGLGSSFTTYSINENLSSNTNAGNEWKTEKDDLWFGAGGGVFRCDGHSLTYLPLPKPEFDSKYSYNPPDRLSRYGVYCTLKDKKGNLWFGTQNMGVCRYGSLPNDSTGQKKSFTWFTEKGLKGPAVLALFEDKSGNIWFGNNGYGLFRYDPSLDDTTGHLKSLTNFTEEHGLSNPDFFKSLQVSTKSGLGTMARIYSINQDDKGDLWIGTIDAGIWRYDARLPDGQGKNLTNYTTKDGLNSNVINTIYKDRKGELWFGTTEGINKFNGVSFTRFFIK